MKQRTLFSLTLLSASITLLAAPDTVDTSFTNNAGTYYDKDDDGGVASVLVQPDGKILVGSNEMEVAGAAPRKQVSLVRFNSDGTVDSDFFSDTHPTGSDAGIYYDATGWPEIHTLGLQSDGKILAAGVLQGFRIGTAGAPTTLFRSNSIVRFNANGTIDTTFQTNGTQLDGGLNYIEDLTVDAQDRILCAGGFRGFRNSISDPYTTRYGIARLNADGSLDTSFHIDPFTLGVPAGATNISGWFRRAVTDSSGKIYIAGTLSWGNTFPKSDIRVFARLFPNGAVDPTFSPTQYGVHDFAIEPNGKVTAIGIDNNVYFFKRFNTDGSVDPGFNFPGGYASFTARPMRRSAAGQYLLAVPNNAAQDKLIRVNSNGSIDTTFAPVTTDNLAGDPGYFGTWDIAPNGKIYSGSGKQFTQGVETHKLVAFEGDYAGPSAGTLNLVLGSATVVENNGNFYAAVTRTGGDTGAASVTLSTSNGSATAGTDYSTVNINATWAAGESGTKYIPIPILTDATQESNETFTITLSTPSGAALGSSTTGSVTILDVDSAPVINAQPQSVSTNAGQSATFTVGVQSNVTVTYQWRLNGTNIIGATSASYTTPGLTEGDTGNSYDVVVTSSAGSVTSTSATVTVSSPDGTPDSAWASPTSVTFATTHGTATLADGTSFVVHAPFQQPTVIKKFLPNGLEDNSYVSPAITNGGNNGNVFSISAAADGKLYLRGIFDSVGGVARPSVARLNADGTLDTGFAPTFGGTHSIGGDTIYATNNGLYLVLKPFGQAGGLARLTDTGAIDSTFKFGNASVQNTFLSVRALQEQADGSILVGYLYGLGASVSSWGFTKLEADGDVDTTFNSITNSGAGLTHYPTGIARRPDGAIFYSTSRQIGLANADGSLNSSFTQPGAFNGNINSIVVIKGKLIAGGAFTDIGGTSAGYIARFLNNGTVDSTFPGGSGADSTINYLRPTNDLKLMVGGNFATFNTGSYPALVKLLMSDPAVEILTPNPVFETDGTVTITLRRSGKTDTAISVDVATMSDSATENVDFSAHSSTVSWGAGDTADKTITVTLLDDSDDEGTEMFSVNLSNPTGTSLLNESTSVTIRDDEAVPNITAQPVAAAVLDNGSATFSVTATSGFALSYQWYFNGNAISGATSDSLTINPATAAEEGNYHVVVSTPDESVTSDSVSLTIVPDPTAVSSLHTSPASAAASGNISVVVAAPDGGAYIGGSFLDFGGNTALDYIAKIKEDGSIDSSFTPPALNNQVYDIALAPNGDVYIAGQFTGTVIKLSPTGTEDTTFSTNRGSGGNNRANTVGVFPDGTIAVAGDFRTWNGTTIAASNQQNSHVVRLNPDGTLTNTRYPNPGHSSHYLLNVDAMQVFDDGRIMVAYDQTSSAYAKARLYNTDGSEVTSFVYPFNSRRVDDIAQFSDGSFLFSGDNSLYHVSATGSVTATYDTSSDWFSSVIQIDGKVISSRNFSSPRVQRFLTDRQLDPIFNTGTKFNNNVYSLALRKDGRLWAAGNFTQYNGTAYPGVILLENHPIALAITAQPVDVIQDPGTTANFTCQAVGTSSLSYQWSKNGNPLSDGGNISGSSTATLSISNIADADEGNYTCTVSNASGNETSSIAKLFVLGAPEVISISPDASVIEGSSAEFTVDAIGAGAFSYQWQKDGSDLTGETSSTLSLSPVSLADAGSYRVVITNSQGSLTSDPITLTVQPNDAAPHPDFTPFTNSANEVRTILELPNGNMLIGGTFLPLNDGTNTSGARLAVVSPTGAILSTTSLNANSTVHKLSLQADGKILVAGNFTTINGVSRSKVARLNSDLTLDTGFTPPSTSTFGAARDIAEDSNGKIIVCGEFANWNGLADTAYLIRFNSDGTHDATFKSTANSWIVSVIPQAGGKYIIAGRFSDYGGNTSADHLTRLNSDGTLDAGLIFNPGFFFAEAAFQTNTGHFLLMNGFASPINKYNSAATLESSFWNNVNANGGSRAFAEDSSGKYLLGGQFTTVAGENSSRIVRTNADGTTDASFSVGSGFDGNVSAITIASDGSIWVGGQFANYNGSPAGGLIRLKGTPSLTPFQQWATSQGLSGNDAEFDADPDGDGLANGVEFLFGTNPTTPQNETVWNPLQFNTDGATINNAIPSAGLDPNKTYRQILVRLPIDQKGLTPVVESSLDLNGFDSSKVHPIGAPQINGNHVLQNYYLTPAIEDAPNHFWRLNVSQ